MRKFTVFSVMLTIVVVVIAAEMFVNDYLPELKIGDAKSNTYTLPNKLDISASGTANVLGTGATTTTEPAQPVNGSYDPTALEGFVNNNSDLNVEISEIPGIVPTISADPTTTTTTPTSQDVSFDIEDFSNSYDHATTNVYITNDNVISAGFAGAYLEPESFDGFLFKTVSIGDLYGLKVDKYSITNGQTNYAKVYVIIPQDVSTTGEIYSVLKVRAAQGLETDINETNQFGDASFFMNDSRRQQIAFLTVKVGSYIYAFSYQKEYHPQVKNLAEMLK